MLRPYTFDYIINDEEDGEPYSIRVEADRSNLFFCFDSEHRFTDFESIPEIDQNKIRHKIELYFFMEDAVKDWSR